MSFYRVIFCLGNPGSGKNTQCDLIKEKYKDRIFHFSCGDLLREEASNPNSKNGEIINQMIKEGMIVPADITCRLAKNQMEKIGKEYVFLIDGFPRNEENYNGWKKVFGDESKIEAVLFLQCSDEVCSSRIKKRSQNSGRIDDNDVSLQKRFDVFKKETLPNIENLTQFSKIIKINSEGDNIHIIFNEICNEIDKILKI